MLWGYNTNGFAHHRLEDALGILADLGYESVAITLDHCALNPYDPGLRAQLARVGGLIRARGLHCVIETGARFLLDPWHKHQPTLLSAKPDERERRLDFLRRAVEIARELGADAVSFWSGSPRQPEAPEVLWERLTDGCRRLSDHAAERGVALAFEPEPGMFIDSLARFGELAQQVGHPAFGLTIDVGHLHCQGETPLGEQLVRSKDLLRNLHIEDMRRGIHEHLMFGEGEIDFGPVLQALRDINYRGGVHVELSRHSHNAVETARRALAFLRAHA
jgi:sugar phosphate isomerase/epimerase